MQVELATTDAFKDLRAGGSSSMTSIAAENREGQSTPSFENGARLRDQRDHTRL
jgi:hypothetical protein